MAEETSKEKPTAAESKDAAADTKEEEATTYEAERLIEESYDFLGEPSHVVAGALEGQRKKNFTLDEAKKLIKDFLKRPVETDNDGSEG